MQYRLKRLTGLVTVTDSSPFFAQLSVIEEDILKLTQVKGNLINLRVSVPVIPAAVSYSIMLTSFKNFEGNS